MAKWGFLINMNFIVPDIAFFSLCMYSFLRWSTAFDLDVATIYRPTKWSQPP